MEIAAWKVIWIVCSFYYINTVSNKSKTQNRKLNGNKLRKLNSKFPNFVLLWLWFFFLTKANKKLIKTEVLGLPGGAVVESLPANAGDAGSSPGLGGSHVLQSGWAREPQLLSLRVWSLCSATREAMTVRGPRTVMKSGPHLPQLEEALAQGRGPNTAK